jgi:hypothetical protein
MDAMSPTRSRRASIVLRIPSELWLPPAGLIALIWTTSAVAYGLFLLALSA